MRAERGDFGNRTDYLAVGYFYRGLNGWLSDDINDARKWLSLGQLKFSYSERAYIYQILPSKDKSAVIDKYLPARTLFSTTLSFLNQNPVPKPGRSSRIDRSIPLVDQSCAAGSGTKLMILVRRRMVSSSRTSRREQMLTDARGPLAELYADEKGSLGTLLSSSSNCSVVLE